MYIFSVLRLILKDVIFLLNVLFCLVFCLFAVVVLFCFVLFCFVLFCFVLFCFVLLCFGLVWFGLVWSLLE